MYAAQNGHEQARSSQFEYVDSCKPLLRTQFHTYSSHHLDQVARALLENGAAVDQTEEDGYTALMLAAQNGHDQVRSSKLQYVDSCRRLLCAQFHTFSSHHLEQVARALLENGGAVNSQNNNGWTALMFAAQNGHQQVRFTA